MNTKEQEFGRKLFEAFQKKDETLYELLQPTNEEYKSLLQLMLAAKVEGLTERKIDEMIERRKTDAPVRFQKDFNALRAQAAAIGIIWTNAVYDNYSWQEMYPEEVHQKYLYGDIWFSVHGVRYFIEEVQAVEMAAGYKLQRIKAMRKAID